MWRHQVLGHSQESIGGTHSLRKKAVMTRNSCVWRIHVGAACLYTYAPHISLAPGLLVRVFYKREEQRRDVEELLNNVAHKVVGPYRT